MQRRALILALTSAPLVAPLRLPAMVFKDGFEGLILVLGYALP